MRETLIVIPAFNEEKNIGTVLEHIISLQPNADILVVNDGSKDNTEAVVKSKKVNLVSLPYNLGYGGALQTGFKYAVFAGYQNVIQFDADGQHNPEDIKKILQCFEKTDADIIIGSRFMERNDYNVGVFKKSGISFLRFFIKLLTGTKVTDPTSGLKGLRKKIINYYAFSDNFSPDYPDADILIMAKRAGFLFYEFPIIVNERTQGQSMHSGLKPIYYFVKFILNISVILLREKLVKGRKA